MGNNEPDIVRRLSSAQRAALRHSVYGNAGDSYFLHSDTRRDTIRVLVRDGYVDAGEAGRRYWLTRKGEAARDLLQTVVCNACGYRTHWAEAACLACGVLKPWADHAHAEEA